MQQISYFEKGIFQTEPTSNLYIDFVLNSIKEGYWKNAVEAVRASDDYKNAKKNLPYVTWSGRFSKRHNDKLLYYSNIICLDIDNLKYQDILNYLEKIKKLNFVIGSFVSPSERGLKVLAKVSGGIRLHFDNFCGLEVVFKKLGIEIDKSGKDVARACFVSYDTNAYINNLDFEEIPSFSLQNEEIPSFLLQKETPSERITATSHATSQNLVLKTPTISKTFDNSVRAKVEKCIELIKEKSIDITANYQNWLKVAAAICSEFGANGESYFLEVSQYNENFNTTEAAKKYQNVLESGSKCSISTFFHICKENGISYKNEPPKTVNTEKNEPPKIVNTENTELNFLSWLQKKGEYILNVSHLDFILAIGQLGFSRYTISKGHSMYVSIQKNIVEQIHEKQTIINHFFTFLSSLPTQVQVKEQAGNEKILFEKKTIQNKMLKGVNTFFQDSYLGTLEARLKFNEDTKHKGFFYYKNGFIEITKDSINFKLYENLENKKIWKNQILEREYKKVINDDDINFNGMFAKFVWFLANGSMEQGSEERKQMIAFMTIIGFLLHRYNEEQTYSINFTDSNEEMTEAAEGRSGKSLIFKAIAQMLNATKSDKCYCEINGKDFKADDKYKYQLAETNTSLICVNDLDRIFDTEVLFNDITEGVQVDKRYAANKFEIKPKIATTTNTALVLGGGSAKARFVEVQVSSYFSQDHTPRDEFGAWFFSSDWDETEWAHFDTFMAQCVQAYLLHGLIRPRNKNLDSRKLMEQTCIEFVEWANEYKFEYNFEYDKKEIMLNFKEKNDFENLKQRTFTSWLRKYAEFHEDYNRKIKNRRSNGIDYITFLKP